MTDSFLPKKQKFPRRGTKVSCRGNKSFTLEKILKLFYEKILIL